MKHFRFLKPLLAGTLLLALAPGLIVSPAMAQKRYTPQALYDAVWKLVYVRFIDQDRNGQDWRIWRHRYDSTIETDEDAYLAIETMLTSLNDRYTRFLNPDEFAEEGRSINATLFGIGIQIGTREDKLVVIAPIEDTPADQAGLKAGDEIMEIDGKPTQGISVKEAADQIRGPKGSKVKLLIRRDKVTKVYDVMRDEIKLKSVTVKNPLNISVPGKMAYIKLSSFLSNNASFEIREALEKASGAKGYILDLRSNPGGLLSNAITIADYFLAEGGIVSTVDRDGYKEVRYADKDVLTDKPLVVLIDAGSASASEILSGALRDHNRALLVGKKSFGKGLVQEINQLVGGSGINITTQRYLTPNDTDINKYGIVPDVDVAITEEDIKKRKDPQLLKAIELMEDMIEGKSIKTLQSRNLLSVQTPAESKEKAGTPKPVDESKKQ